MDRRSRFLFKNNVNHEEQVSEFYNACRNGNIDAVKQLLPTIPYDQLNQLEPNGSTPLHAATRHGHVEITRLLLHDYSCPRHQQDRHRLTAYEQAQTDTMRQLYHRPSNKNRFSDESDDVQQTFQIIPSSSLKRTTATTDEMEGENNQDEDAVEKPHEKWLTCYRTNEEIQKQLEGLNGVKALLRSHLGRFIMKQAMKHTLNQEDCGYDEEEYAYIANKTFGLDALHKLLDDHVTVEHPDYEHCCHLLDQYIRERSIESLLTLYTMETPFYRQLSIAINPLALPLFMHLSRLKQRHYQGLSYRGLWMTHEELDDYRWAFKNKDSVISTAKFASTSIDRHTAEEFAVQSSSTSAHKLSVLLVLHFPQPCDTAINLTKIPEYQLPCLSNFENEREVLLAPRTFFKVKGIENNPLNDQYIIYLDNVCGEHKTIVGTVTFFLKLGLKNRLHRDR